MTVIIGMDMAFHEQLPKLFPHTDARSWFAGKPDADRQLGDAQLQPAGRLPDHRGARAGPGLRADERLRRRQGGRRLLGRHRGARPISSARWAHGDPAKVLPRSPRLAFDEACRLPDCPGLASPAACAADPIVTDPWFYAVAVPAVLLMGLAKSGFAGGFGALAVPLMALTVPVPQAAAIMLPLLMVMDATGLAAAVARARPRRCCSCCCRPGCWARWSARCCSACFAAGGGRPGGRADAGRSWRSGCCSRRGATHRRRRAGSGCALRHWCRASPASWRMPAGRRSASTCCR